MNKAYFVTTPIYYVNASPHIGHAYTTIVADVLARYHRLQGYETFFLTGSDEHGDKIAAAAAAAAVSPKAYADKISAQFQELWPQLMITNDHFIRTTDAEHIRTVQCVLQKVYDNGDIYFGEYGGFYCVGCERFYTEKELIDGRCPDHQTEPEYRKENNYFFKMGKYQDWLIGHIKSHEDFIRPERYRNEVLSFLKEPLEDLCISRPKTRLEWGITLPFDEGYVTYVWFDALINYITAIGYPQGEGFEKFWSVSEHLIAKDILKPHGIYWPTMLKAAGLAPYRRLSVHGYWNIEQSKMSKSLGNVVKPLALKDKYGLDAFRYFLLRDMVFGLDANFSEAALARRVNTDLANDLGNLASRVLTMAVKYCAGKTPARPLNDDGTLAAAAAKAATEFMDGFEQLAFHKALMSLWEFINSANKYIVANEPWVLAKTAANEERLNAVLYNLLESLRVIAILISPVMPSTAAKLLAYLGINDTQAPAIAAARRWGELPAGLPITKGEALFPRVEYKEASSESEPQAVLEKSQALPSEANKVEISYDDFAKVDLRAAKVLQAEIMPQSKKLLKLQVDIGGEQRQLIAGIAAAYRPEELLGKYIVVVANLKPTKLMGEDSLGMLLAADSASGLTLLTFDKEPRGGAKVK